MERRLATGLIGVFALVGCFVVAWEILPLPRPCLSIDCGTAYSSGAANVLGSGNFTWPQTAFMIFGIAVGSFLIVFAALPSRRHVAAAIAVVMTTFVVAVAIPNEAPKLWGTTLATLDNIPVDHRIALRSSVVTVGLLSAGAIVLFGRRRRTRIATGRSMG